MAKEKKKGFVLRALDTVEHVGNALPNPATIFLILTGVVIVLSAICAACGVSVTYDFADTADSLYAPEYLETKNQYGFFLNDNHAFIEIHTGYNAGKTLFVIKDSYANSMIPLLTAHYETIYVVDLRYFNGKLFQLMEQYEPEQGMDVLVLYDCIHFLEDFKFY